MQCQSAPSCPCRVPAGASATAEGVHRVLIASATAHSASAAGAAVRDLGLDPAVRGTVCEVTVDDVDALVRALGESLSEPEKQESRMLVVDGEVDLQVVAAALSAPTIAVHAARSRARPLGQALTQNSTFHSAYQPIVDLSTNQPIAYEALLRGEVDGQSMPPGEMFAVAEEAGWLEALDRIGRERAILGAAGWLGDADLFVNFNPTSIYRPEVCLATTERAIDKAGLRMDQLVFEVVESHHIDSMDHLLDVLRHYREMGCRVAMDDMGAGYASLTSLSLIQPDVVKLDKELVQRLPDPAAVSVVRSILSMSRDMGASVIAECVETAEQVVVARDLGVDWAQGWFFARPMTPPVEFDLPAIPRPDGTAYAGPGAAVVGRQLDVLARRAIDSSTVAMAIADVRLDDMPIVHVNDAFTRLTGMAASDVLGRNGRIMRGPDADPDAARAMARAIGDGAPITTHLQNRRPDGTTWAARIDLSPIRDDDGVVTHYLAVHEEIPPR
jgi:PAS domain S-box-containing protein